MSKSKKLAVNKEKKATAPAEAQMPPFERLHREIDRLFDDFGRMDWRLPFARSDFDISLPWSKREDWGVTPVMDLAEKDNEYEITAELPGMDEKDIDIRVSNGSLRISGEKTEGKGRKEERLPPVGAPLRIDPPDDQPAGRREPRQDRGVVLEGCAERQTAEDGRSP